MTKFSKALKAMLQNQVNMLTRTLMFNWLVIAVVCAFTLFSAEMRHYWSIILLTNAIIWSMIFMIVYLIRLAISSRNNLRSNRFRLIPISETKLYLSSILSSFIGLIYVYLVQAILIIVLGVLAFFTTSREMWHFDGLNWHNAFNSSLSGLILGFLSPILIILLVHLIDFFSSFILNYIPGGAQKLAKFVVYLVVVILAIYVTSNLFKICISLLSGTLFYVLNSIWISDAFLVGFVIVIGLINVLLLRSVETIR